MDKTEYNWAKFVLRRAYMPKKLIDKFAKMKEDYERKQGTYIDTDNRKGGEKT